MASNDPDIVELQHQIDQSGFGPMTRNALAGQLGYAAKCNGGPNDLVMRYLLVNAVQMALSEPERQAQYLAAHQVACVRVTKVEAAVAALQAAPRSNGADIEIPLPGDRKILLHGAVAYLGLIVILVGWIGYLHVASETNRKTDLAPIKAALGMDPLAQASK